MVTSRLEEDQKKGSQLGKKIYQTNLYHYAGTGHLAIDYARLMKLGYGGLIKEAEDALANLSNIRPRVADIFGPQNPPCWKNFRREG